MTTTKYDVDLSKVTPRELVEKLNDQREADRIMEPDEYGFDLSTQRGEDGRPQEPLWPSHGFDLCAFAVVGANEGYYVHVEAYWSGDYKRKPGRELIALAKTNDLDHALALATSASRFIMSRCIW
jgi:hypothetical protein